MFSIRVNDRISMVLAEERHAPIAFALVDRNRDHLQPWMAWVEKTKTVEDTAAFYRMCLELFAKGQGFCTLIFDGEEAIGSIGLVCVDKDKRRTEIGYWLDRAHTGKGVMTACVRALLPYLFNELGFNRVEIRVDVENKPSRAIPERLGFKQEGILRDASLLAGQRLGDLVVYGMLAREWERNDEV